MFTVEQIKEAHSKVKTGADFPNYIKDLGALGITYYQTFVEDGHTDYFGKNDFKVSSSKVYGNLVLSKNLDLHQFKNDLLAHQQGKTDYFTFCKNTADAGIAYWLVDINLMTCTYCDNNHQKVLVETIPQ